jgi:hypothetical protein
MTRSRADVVRLSSLADLIALVPPLLGFMPAESVVIVCLGGRRRRVGLAMRFDLADIEEVESFVEMVDERVGHEHADAAFAVVFSTVNAENTAAGSQLPHAALADALMRDMSVDVVDVLLTTGDRWWSYRCTDPSCCPRGGTPISLTTPGATAVTAAYALAGQGVLPDRDAVVRSMALVLSTEESESMRRRIASLASLHEGLAQDVRRALVRALVERLTSQLIDPRATISPGDVAEFAALCRDVVVRDEVLIGAVGVQARERLLPVLREVVRRVPPPHDSSVCAMLAWVSYADGDGVVANVALARSLATDPDYSLAGLIADALYRQVPPQLLEEVMRGAARDLKHRREAG